MEMIDQDLMKWTLTVAHFEVGLKCLPDVDKRQLRREYTAWLRENPPHGFSAALIAACFGREQAPVLAELFGFVFHGDRWGRWELNMFSNDGASLDVIDGDSVVCSVPVTQLATAKWEDAIQKDGLFAEDFHDLKRAIIDINRGFGAAASSERGSRRP